MEFFRTSYLILIIYSACTICIPIEPLTCPGPGTSDHPANTDGITFSSSSNSSFIYYCEGHAGESTTTDLGCAGPCTLYTLGTPTNCNRGKICAPQTNCIATDGSVPFTVCDASLQYCTEWNRFHPGRDGEGRFVYNTVGTGYVYVPCTGECLVASW